MTLAEQKNYQVLLKIRGGEVIESRTWLVKQSALDYLMKSLEQGHFAWGSLLHLELGTECLLDIEEYFN